MSPEEMILSSVNAAGSGKGVFAIPSLVPDEKASFLEEANRLHQKVGRTKFLGRDQGQSMNIKYNRTDIGLN